MITRFPTSFIPFLFAFLAVLCPLHSQTTDAFPVIPKIDSPPVIDAQIDQIWHARPGLAISRVQTGTVDGAADCLGTWYGLHTNQRFYILVDIDDEFVTSTYGTAEYLNDRIEVYFNMDNAKPNGGNARTGDNYQYAFNWNMPSAKLGGSNANWDGVEWAHASTDDGWVVELSIPWSSLDISPPSVGFSFGFDIAINDNDGEETYDGVLYWFNSTGNALYGNIDGAGTIEMGAPFDGNYAPDLKNPGVQTAVEGQSSTINLSAEDFNGGDTLSLSASGLPTFASFTDHGDRTASVTINAVSGDFGIYEFIATASDGSLSDEETITLIVKDPTVAAQVPVFDPVDDLSVTEGDLATFEITVSDPDSLSVSITANNPPAFVSIEDHGDKSATVSINPGFETAGDYTVDLVATDETNTTGTLSFTLTVAPAEQRTAFYCDPASGSMENTGSPTDPWSSLEEVFAAGKLFRPGDVIHLRSGHHGEPVITGANTDYVYIRPDEGAEPTVSKITFAGSASRWELRGIIADQSLAPTPTNGTIMSIGGAYNVVRDCQIYSIADSSSWSADDWVNKGGTAVTVNGQHNLIEDSEVRNIRWGIFINGDFGVVRRCRVFNFSGDAMRVLGDDNVIEYCYIADNYNVDSNHDDGIQSYSNGPGGVGTGVVYRATLRGNVIIQTTDPDRPFQGSLQGIGLFDGVFDGFVVENNVVVVNMWHGIAIYGANNCSIINNTVVDQDMNSSPGPTWIGLFPHKNYNPTGSGDQNDYLHGRNNVVKNNIATRVRGAGEGFGVYENNRTITESDFDLYFVDYPYDLRLRAGSPAIDEAITEDAPAVDADGHPRPIDGDGDGEAEADLGAYEFAAWRNHSVIHDGWTFTGEQYLGWVFVSSEPWLYSLSIGKWIYSPASYFSSNACWVYLVGYGASSEGWYVSNEFDTWAYNYSSGQGGWTYILNTGS
jgi:parallel beta-helix repeat protein